MLFSDIAGQMELKQRLIQTVHDHRISHAQLFSGGEGFGTLSLALAYAQFINCTGRTPAATDSCGVCPSCRQNSQLAHPDLHFLYPVATNREVNKKPVSTSFLHHWRKLVLDHAGYINLPMWYSKIQIENKQGIINADDCNNLIRTLSYKSYEAEFKVMIIWMVEKLFHAAAPKLLKILEEPPDKTLLLLITENPGQIIPTILSRAQMIKVPPIDADSLRQALISRNNCDAETARKAAEMAGGNLIEAIKTCDENSEEVFFQLFRDWMRLCYSNRVEALNDWLPNLAKLGRERQKAFLAYAADVIRLCLLHHIRPEAVGAEGEEKEFIAKFSARVSLKNIDAYYVILNQAAGHIERNANATILFMDVSLRLHPVIHGA